MNCILEWDGLLSQPGGWETGALLYTRPCLDYYPPTSVIKSHSVDSYGLCSNDQLLLSVPFARTELGLRSFMYSAPSTWNMLQKDWKITESTWEDLLYL